MVPIQPAKPIDQRMNNSAGSAGRAVREQAYYDEYGSDSIVAFSRLLLAASELRERWLGVLARPFFARCRGRRNTVIHAGQRDDRL